jgi:hypothetical protein
MQWLSSIARLLVAEYDKVEVSNGINAIKKLRALSSFSIHAGVYCFEIIAIYLSENWRFPN